MDLRPCAVVWRLADGKGPRLYPDDDNDKWRTVQVRGCPALTISRFPRGQKWSTSNVRGRPLRACAPSLWLRPDEVKARKSWAGSASVRAGPGRHRGPV